MVKGSYTRDREEKINCILKSFKDLVNKNGYDKLSTRHIAEAAGISVGIIYHYFPEGKPSIAMSYLEKLTQKIFDPTMFMAARDDEKRRALYSDFIKKHLDSHRENLEIHRALDQAILGNQEVRKHNSEIIRINLKSVAEELIKRGSYKDLPSPEVIKKFIINFKLIEAVVHRHLLVEPFFDSDAELVDFLTEIFLSLDRFKITPKKDL